MAIIYTYPKLQAPQGNELIVVTDVNNKNATRLITIADIASLVPGGGGGGGCSTAITGIQTSAGNYAAVLCNEVTFAGSGISISADQNTSTVTFAADPQVAPCATSDKAGTVKIADPFIETELQVAEEGVYYALQVTEDCAAGIRVPQSSANIPCTTPTVLGGTKNLLNGTVISPPSVSESGNYYPIEVINSDEAASQDVCRAIVRVPSSGQGIACATPEALGGIYANSVELPTGNPGTAESGNYYPVQLITGSDGDDCFPVVRVPNANDGTLTITVDGTPSTFTANQASDTNISITTGGSGGTSKNGFTPMSIYDSSNTIPEEIVSTFVQTVVEDDCKINKVDFASTGAAPNNTVIALYRGKLNDPTNTILLGSGTLTGASFGEFIYTIDLIPVGGSSGDTIDITAGEDIVIFYSRTASGFHLGKATTSFTNNAIGQKVSNPQIVEADLVDNITTVITNSGAGESTNEGVPRLGCHFYEGETSQDVQRFAYKRCDNVSTEGACANMPSDIIIEAEASVLLDYLIIEDTSVRDTSCCYFKTNSTTDPITNNMAIIGTFVDCEVDNLPASCTGE